MLKEKTNLIPIVVIYCFALIQSHLLCAQHTIIPEPVSYQSSEQVFEINSDIQIIDLTGKPASRIYIQQFRDYLFHNGLALDLYDQLPKKSIPIIHFNLLDPNIQILDKEGYQLEITKAKISVSANQTAGIFNAIQTIKQLLPLDLNEIILQDGKVKIPGCKIEDYPRYNWRGLMLDVSRHFFSVEEIKSFIDKMSMYKFNVFHWHLTDDEGWRIEIKSLPKLTEVGAWRVQRHGQFGEDRLPPKPDEPNSYGGYYTQEEIREVVKYASERNIMIVPEIDMPGHSMAALAAYPELSTKKEPKYVNPGAKFAEWYGGGKFKMLIENTLNPADERVYDFADKVISEVAGLFPGDYIHVGGDECYHGFWDKDIQVQQFMKKNNIENSAHLQNYFMKRIERIVNGHGKKMIGWEEIVESDLDASSAIMTWRRTESSIEATKKKRNVVLSPITHAYLDYTQGDHSVENPIYDDLSLETSYEFEPSNIGLDENYLLGGQGNIWTEAMPTMQFVYYMTYPRAFALSETFWTPSKGKNWDSFIWRTEKHFEKFDNANTNISKAVYDPIIHISTIGDEIVVALSNSIPNTEIRYTLNNTYPPQFGKLYEGPFKVPDGNVKLITQTFRDGVPLGRVLIISNEEIKKRAGKT